MRESINQPNMTMAQALANEADTSETPEGERLVDKVEALRSDLKASLPKRADKTPRMLRRIGSILPRFWRIDNAKTAVKKAVAKKAAENKKKAKTTKKPAKKSSKKPAKKPAKKSGS